MYTAGVVSGCLAYPEAVWCVMQYFDANSVECYILALPTVEANKGFDLVFEVARHLEKFALNRCEFCILTISGSRKPAAFLY